MTVGSVIAGIRTRSTARMARMFIVIVVAALALVSMMFLIMVRVSDPLLPRAIFGVLNTLLFFPSAPCTRHRRFPDGCGYRRGGRSPTPARVQSPLLKNTVSSPCPATRFLVAFTDDRDAAARSVRRTPERATGSSAAAAAGSGAGRRPRTARLLETAAELVPDRESNGVTVRESLPGGAGQRAAGQLPLRDKLGSMPSGQAAIDAMRETGAAAIRRKAGGRAAATFSTPC